MVGSMLLMSLLMSLIRSKDSAVRVRCQNGLLIFLWVLLAVSWTGSPAKALPGQAPTPTEVSVSMVTQGNQSATAAATVTYAPIMTITRQAPQPTVTPGCPPNSSAPIALYDVDSVVDW